MLSPTHATCAVPPVASLGKVSVFARKAAAEKIIISAIAAAILVLFEAVFASRVSLSLLYSKGFSKTVYQRF
jgi:hypothetical protein